MKLLVVTGVSGGGKTLGVQTGMVTLGMVTLPKNFKQLKIEPFGEVKVDKGSADALADVFQKAKEAEAAENQQV